MLKAYDEMSVEQRFAYKMGYTQARIDLLAGQIKDLCREVAELKLDAESLAVDPPKEEER